MNPYAALKHARARFRVALKERDTVTISRARIRVAVAALNVAIEEGVDGIELEEMLQKLRHARHQHARLCRELGIYAPTGKPA